MNGVDELALRYGTPLYVYDLDRVSAACQDLVTALPSGFSVCYSIKANPHPEVVGAVRENVGHSCRAEVSSTGELTAALTAGFAAAECLYTGPGKTVVEVDDAIRQGVRLFSAESLGDLRRIGQAAARAGAVAECLIRVNSAAPAGSTSVRMTGTPSQFGFDSELVAAAAQEIKAVPGVRVVGAHFFPLSNSSDEDNLIAEFRQSVAMAAEIEQWLGIRMRMLDLGGGFAAPYAAQGQRPVYRRLRAELASALDASLPHWRQGEIEIACESGRYLVGDCGTLVASVVNTKVGRGRRFAILDAGINTLGGMAGLGRLLPLSVEPNHEPGAVTTAEQQHVPVNLVGPLCTPGDILARNINLTALESGDLVTIPNVGAYGLTASLVMFLGRPAPTEVIVRSGAVVSASRIEHRRVGVVPPPPV